MSMTQEEFNTEHSNIQIKQLKLSDSKKVLDALLIHHSHRKDCAPCRKRLNTGLKIINNRIGRQNSKLGALVTTGKEEGLFIGLPRGPPPLPALRINARLASTYNNTRIAHQALHAISDVSRLHNIGVSSGDRRIAVPQVLFDVRRARLATHPMTSAHILRQSGLGRGGMSSTQIRDAPRRPIIVPDRIEGMRTTETRNPLDGK